MRFMVATTVATLAVLATALSQSFEQKFLGAIPITKYCSLLNSDKTINFETFNSHVASVNAKILRGSHNFEKNTGTPHHTVLNGGRKHRVGDALTTDRSSLWYGTISVGTPPKTFTVEFDTGSGQVIFLGYTRLFYSVECSDLFLPALTCDSGCDGHTLWDPTSSSSARAVLRPFQVMYADGTSVSGKSYTDMVSIAGFTASSQAIGVALTYSSGFGFSHFPADGLMGMGFQSISTFPASPVFATLVSEGQIAVSDSAFSFKLSSSGGELYIGGSNSALYTGSFTYIPVTREGFWQVNMDNIQVNGTAIVSDVEVIVDTGTTLIVGPPSQVSTLYQTLGGKTAPSSFGKAFYTFPCNSFPDVSLGFGGKSFPIPASTLNLGRVTSSSSECVSGIIPGGHDGSFWIVGDLFLRGVYTTFDLGNLQVGFAQLA